MIQADLYIEGSSWLHRADARVKLFLTITFLLLLLVNQNLPLQVFGVLSLLLLHRSAALPSTRLRTVGITLLPVSLLMFALRAVFYPQGSTLTEVGPVTITALGLADGAVVGLRIVAMALAVLLWLHTTRSRDVVRSLRALGLPFSWGLSFSLALRFLPQFIESYRAIEQAQQSRGLDLSKVKGLPRIRARSPIFVAMLINTLRSSEQMAVALEARAFGSSGPARTDLEPLEFRRQDALLLAAILLVLIASLLGRFVYGLGMHPWRPLV